MIDATYVNGPSSLWKNLRFGLYFKLDLTKGVAFESCNKDDFIRYNTQPSDLNHKPFLFCYFLSCFDNNVVSSPTTILEGIK